MLQCTLRESHYFFSAVRQKSGGTVPPTPEKLGHAYGTPVPSRKLHLCLKNTSEEEMLYLQK